MIKNKRVLVTGGAGSIGSELARQLSSDNKVYIVDINESGLFDILSETGAKGRVGDIRDKETMNDVFSDFRPQIVFHAAAYKHVPLMEDLPEEAIHTNIIGTRNVLRYSKIYPIEKFVFISTDKAVAPKTIMGGTKMLGEVMTRNSGKGYLAVRFGNVLGSRGSVVPIWQKQINYGEPVTVTDPEMTRYFMTIPEAVELVIKAGEEGKGGEVFVLDMGEQINILDLARKIVDESRKDIPIKIIGRRPGEQIHERLMSKEEEEVAIKRDKFFIIYG